MQYTGAQKTVMFWTKKAVSHVPPRSGGMLDCQGLGLRAIESSPEEDGRANTPAPETGQREYAYPGGGTGKGFELGVQGWMAVPIPRVVDAEVARPGDGLTPGGVEPCLSDRGHRAMYLFFVVVKDGVPATKMSLDPLQVRPESVHRVRWRAPDGHECHIIHVISELRVLGDRRSAE